MVNIIKELGVMSIRAIFITTILFCGYKLVIGNFIKTAHKNPSSLVSLIYLMGVSSIGLYITICSKIDNIFLVSGIIGSLMSILCGAIIPYISSLDKQDEKQLNPPYFIIQSFLFILSMMLILR